MMFGKFIAAALTSAALAAPVQAQSEEQNLSNSQVELFAEMMAMGQVCSELPDFHVASEDLGSWLASQLAAETDADIDRVLARRDGKFTELQSRAATVRDMPQGSARQDAVDGHYAGLIGRCNRMANHDAASAYFLKG